MPSSLRDGWQQETGCNAVVILPWYWKLPFLFFSHDDTGKAEQRKSISQSQWLWEKIHLQGSAKGAEYRLLGDCHLLWLVPS